MRIRSSADPMASTGHACATVVVVGGGGAVSRSSGRRRMILQQLLPLVAAACLFCVLLRPTTAYPIGRSSSLFTILNPSVQAIGGNPRIQGRAQRERYPSSFVLLTSTSPTSASETNSSRRPPLRSLVRRPLASFVRRIFNNKRKDSDRDSGDDSELIVTEMDGAGGGGYDPVPGGADSDDPTTLSATASSSGLAPLSSLLAPPSMTGPTPPSSPSAQGTSPSSSSPLGGVVGVMEQLDAFRASQRVGAQTSQLLNDLQNYVQVDAASYGNHVKITMDGRQRVKSVEIDDQFLRTSEPYEVSAAVLEALQLAHDKSTDKMDEKVKAFYAKLGLLGGAGGGGV